MILYSSDLVHPHLGQLAKQYGIDYTTIKTMWEKVKQQIAKQYPKLTLCSDEFVAKCIEVLKKQLSKNQNVNEMTTTQDIPEKPDEIAFDGVILNDPVFDVNDEIFFNLHKTTRQYRQWWKTWAKDKRIAEFCRQTKGRKPFYIRWQGMFRKIKP